MKKIIILTAILLLVFTSLSFAAKKTTTKYLRAGDMGNHMPLNQEDFVKNDPTNAITGSLADNNLSFGAGKTNTSGSYFYGGDSDIADCFDGKCSFGIGVRIYYEFTFLNADTSSDSSAYADGYTFTIVNGSINTKNSTGGSPSTISMGELLGYAGPGRIDQLGLRSPKMAIEFDVFANNGASDICAASSRNDADNNNHIALMLWGDNPSGNCTICTAYNFWGSCTTSTLYPKSTFDDNRHGSGTGTNPVNSSKTDGLGGYYAGAKNGSANWMEDGQPHNFRLEITRGTTPTSGQYAYNIKAWVDCPGCTADQLKTFKELSVAYGGLTPKINRTVLLTAADHQAFEKMIFGWTFATGSSTQTTTFRNFDIYFPKSSCAYYINQTSASFDKLVHSGNTINVVATPDASCAWTAVSNLPAWLQITSPTSPVTGNGTVTYNVSANSTGVARTGTITIGDQIFTVTQAR